MKKVFTFLMAVLGFATNVSADVEWTIWEGTQAFDTEKGGSIDIASYCKTIQVGDILTFHIDVSGYDFHQKYLGVKSATTGWSETTIASWEGIEGNFTQEVTSTIYTEVISNNGMFNAGGKGYTLNKITLTRQIKSFIKKSLTSLSKNGSFDGNLLANAEAGDYIYVEGTVSDGESYGSYSLMGNSVNSETYAIYDKLMFPLTEEQLTAWTTNETWPWSSLTNLSHADVSYVHPVTSFSIGSIGYATFSASQEVTAPAEVTAYRGTVSGDKLVLTPFTDNVIPANTGAIIAGTEGAVLEFTASSMAASESSELLACTSATTVSSLAEEGYDLYILYNNPTGGNTAFSLSDLNCGWNSSYNAATHTITFDGEWKGRGWGWNFDYSDYSKIVVEFDAAPQAGVLSVQYNDNNETPTTESANYSQGATSVEIALNASLKNNVSQVYLSASAASTLTLTNAYLVSNAGSQKAEFRKTTSGTLAANKAYLKIAQGSPTRLSIAFEDDMPTGISTVEKSVKSDDRIYNLNGQVVKNVVRGLYIKNGKKYFVK